MIQTTFLIISILSLIFFYFGIGKQKRVLFVFSIWQMLIGILAIFKVFEDFPTLFAGAILGTIALTIMVLKKLDKQALNLSFLLSIHVLRIPVELVLFQLFIQHKIPKLMTFNGWNFDIVIGISALLILIFQLVKKSKISRRFFVLWNLMGISFLMIIVSLAVLASPLPIQQFAFEQPNIAVLAFPYCLLPTCVVPIVFMSHTLLINNYRTNVDDN